MASLIKVTLKRGLSKCTPKQLSVLQGLGLKRRGAERIVLDTVPNRGMIILMQHMLEVERFDGDESQRDSARLRKKRGEVRSSS